MSSNPQTIKECWRCSAERSPSALFFCPQCKAIQPPDQSVDYFRLLGAEPAFFLNLPAIEQRYKDLQKKLHPDMYATKSEIERDFSAEQSTQVNRAYSTLVTPLSRAIYLLKLKGVEAGEEDEGTISDMELLSEVMEIREAVEDAESTDELQKLRKENAQKMQKDGAAFSEAVHAGNLEEALRWIHRMTYWDRIDKEIIRRL